MQIFHHKISIDGAVIYYCTAGEFGKQPLVFLHGWPGLNLLESGIIQELANHFYVIAPEHPGLSRSDTLSHYTNIFEQYAEVSYQILKKQLVEKRSIVVVGQSFGGAVASAFAYKYPDEIKMLVLVDSAGVGQYTFWMRLLFLCGPSFVRFLRYLPQPFKQLGLKIIFGADKIEDKKAMRRRVAMVDNRTMLAKTFTLNKQYGSFPILMVWGDKDGKEFNLYGSCHVDAARELYEKMKKERQDIRFVTVAGGHTVLYQKPQEVVSIIINNLNELASGRLFFNS